MGCGKILCGQVLVRMSGKDRQEEVRLTGRLVLVSGHLDLLI